MPRRLSITREKAREKKLARAVPNVPVTNFDSCPHCESQDGYYSKSISEGMLCDVTLWDHASKENSQMHDSLSDIWVSRFYYCLACDKAICRRNEKAETAKFFDSIPKSNSD